MRQLFRLVLDLLCGALLGVIFCYIVGVALFIPLDYFNAPAFTLKLGPVAFISFHRTPLPGVTFHDGLLWLGVLLGLAFGLWRYTRQRR